MAKFNELLLPYPDFQLGKVIDPEEHDLNNSYLTNKINEFVEFLNQLIGSGDESGATLVGIKPQEPFTSTNVQTALDELITRLKSFETNTGASLIGSSTLVKMAGNTVEAQLASLDAFLQTAYVITSSIADLNVTTAKLANQSVTTDKIGDGSVTTPKLANTSITTDKVANDAITTAKIANLNITSAKIADLTIISQKIADLAITTAKLAQLSVTTDKLAELAVTSGKIANQAIVESKLSDMAVTSSKIASNAILTTHIANLSVTTAKLADRSVTGNKIGLETIKAENVDPTLLNSLPNTLLSAKVLKLEEDAIALFYFDQLQVQENRAIRNEAIASMTSHKTARLPHQQTDNVTGKTYNTGWVVENGELYFEYEEV